MQIPRPKGDYVSKNVVTRSGTTSLEVGQQNNSRKFLTSCYMEKEMERAASRVLECTGAQRDRLPFKG